MEAAGFLVMKLNSLFILIFLIINSFKNVGAEEFLLHTYSSWNNIQK